MTARILSLTDRLPPEAPVRRDMTLYGAKLVHLYVEMALNLPDPSPSELIAQLAVTTDPAERDALIERIRRSAP